MIVYNIIFDISANIEWHDISYIFIYIYIYIYIYKYTYMYANDIISMIFLHVPCAAWQILVIDKYDNLDTSHLDI